MSLAMWAIFLLVLGLILLAAELLLPTHGLLGILALLAALGGVVACYQIDPWLGAGVFIGGLVAAPFAWALFIKVWPKTPVGRKIILQTVAGQMSADPCAIRVGDVGRAVSELRPIGECEFGDARIEAVSEYGIIGAGTPVKVVAIAHNRPTVRAV